MTEPLCVIQNLNHVCLAVNDIEETLDFYQGDYKNYNEDNLKDLIYKTGKFAVVK